jgi:hypothetical protein
MSVGGYGNSGDGIVTDGLIFSVDPYNKKSYVSGDTTCIDLTKNKYPGNLVNSPSFDINAWSFDGTNQEVEISTGFGVLQPPLPITVDCWVYINVMNGSYGIFTIDQNGTNYFGVALHTSSNDGGSLSLSIGDGLGFGTANRKTLLTSNSDQPLQEWFHCCVVYTNPGFTPDIKCYINGEDVGGNYSGTGTGIGWSNDVNSRTRLGVKNGIGGGNIDALISSTKVYNRGLSADEAKQNYNALKWRFK